jgi:hypothetical protein
MWQLRRPEYDPGARYPKYMSPAAFDLIQPLQARLVGYTDLNTILPGGVPYIGWARNLRRRAQQHVGLSPGGNTLMQLLQGCLNHAVGSRKYRLVYVRILPVTWYALAQVSEVLCTHAAQSLVATGGGCNDAMPGGTSDEQFYEHGWRLTGPEAERWVNGIRDRTIKDETQLKKQQEKYIRQTADLEKGLGMLGAPLSTSTH